MICVIFVVPLGLDEAFYGVHDLGVMNVRRRCAYMQVALVNGSGIVPEPFLAAIWLASDT